MEALAAKEDLYYMDLALEEARQAAREGEIPVGAVLVVDGAVIARDHNKTGTAARCHGPCRACG